MFVPLMMEKLKKGSRASFTILRTTIQGTAAAFFLGEKRKATETYTRWLSGFQTMMAG